MAGYYPAEATGNPSSKDVNTLVSTSQDGFLETKNEIHEIGK